MPDPTLPIQPGSTIAMLGGGQLGRMSILAGRQFGYRFIVLDPSPDCCAGPVADEHIVAAFEDRFALQRLAQTCVAATCEFENVPVAAMEYLQEQGLHCAPGHRLLRIAQNRIREKRFLRENGFPTATFATAATPEELDDAIRAIGFPCVAKSAETGYDGRGQQRLESDPPSVRNLFVALGGGSVVVEGWVKFERECSVIVAANGLGEVKAFPVAENIHRNHILHKTFLPARIDAPIAEAATSMAIAIAEKCDLSGLLAVEFFVGNNGRLTVNELAPRPHNSGHATIEACPTGQFHQHIRAVCGLPLGPSLCQFPAVMINLLGECWSFGNPDWAAMLKNQGIGLHLYDKGTPRPGRKMGHLTAIGTSIDVAEERAKRAWSIANPDTHSTQSPD